MDTSAASSDLLDDSLLDDEVFIVVFGVDVVDVELAPLLAVLDDGVAVTVVFGVDREREVLLLTEDVGVSLPVSFDISFDGVDDLESFSLLVTPSLYKKKFFQNKIHSLQNSLL